MLFLSPGRVCVKLANAVPASLEPLRQLDLMYPTTANSTGRWQRAGYGSQAPEIVSRMDSMRANLVGSKQRELRTFEARW